LLSARDAALKLCFNKVLQFLTWVLANAGCPDNDHKVSAVAAATVDR